MAEEKWTVLICNVSILNLFCWAWGKFHWISVLINFSYWVWLKLVSWPWVACNAGVFLEREHWIILRCCHLGRGSARGLERVKSDPKGEDDWLPLHPPPPLPLSLLQIRELNLLFSAPAWKTPALQARPWEEICWRWLNFVVLDLKEISWPWTCWRSLQLLSLVKYLLILTGDLLKAEPIFFLGFCTIRPSLSWRS